MTTTDGISSERMGARIYPWQEIRTVDAHLEQGRVVRRLAIAATLVAALLSLVSFAALAWAWRGYRRINDNWRWRPAVILAVGVLLTLITFRPQTWAERVAALGAEASGSFGGLLGLLLVAAIGPSLVLAALAGAGFCYAAEWTEHRYLEPTGATVRQRWRSARNVRNLRSGRIGRGRLGIGVITDDPVGWRTPRRGMLVGRPIADLGHGCIIGESDTDTAITAATLADQALAAGASVIYLDCAGSADTLARTAAVADRQGAALTVFDVGIGASRSRWYDPLGWRGTPAEKTAALLSALAGAHPQEDRPEFDEATRTWVGWQFAAMEEFGLFPGESRFDFLLDTCDPDRFRDRIERYRAGHGGPSARYATWESRLRPYTRDQFAGVADDLVTIVNAAGPRLRPSHAGDLPISFAELDADQGLVHLRMAAASDTDFVRRALVALAARDLTAHALDRSEGDHRELLVLADQVGLIGDRVDAVDDLIIAAEGTGTWVWPVTSSLAEWPTSTRSELTAGGATMIIHRVRNPRTAALVSAAVGTVPVLEPDSGAADDATIGRLVDEHPGELRGRIGSAALLDDDDLQRLEDHTAYVCCTAAGERRRSATIERWQPTRVRGDVIAMDAPLVRVITPAAVLAPAPVEQGDTPTFADLVAPAAELAQAQAEMLPPAEARERRMAEYRSRHRSAPAPRLSSSVRPATSVAGGRTDWWEDPVDPAAAAGVDAGTGAPDPEADAEWQDAGDGWAEQWEPVDAPPLGSLPGVPVGTTDPQQKSGGSREPGPTRDPSEGVPRTATTDGATNDPISRQHAGGVETTSTGGADQSAAGSKPGNGRAARPSSSGRPTRSRRTRNRSGTTGRSNPGGGGDGRTR